MWIQLGYDFSKDTCISSSEVLNCTPLKPQRTYQEKLKNKKVFLNIKKKKLKKKAEGNPLIGSRLDRKKVQQKSCKSTTFFLYKSTKKNTGKKLSEGLAPLRGLINEPPETPRNIKRGSFCNQIDVLLLMKMED